MEKILNYINGEFLPPQGGEFIDNFEPARGEVYSQVPDSKAEDVQRAVEAAREAFPGWSSLSVENRSEILLRISQLIEENLDDLARAESIDNGKPLSLARAVDIPRAASNFRFFATAILHFASQFHRTGKKALNYTLRRPLGPVACISPWNLPLYLFTWKIAPALAAGNCVVGKPSEVTPMTAYLLGKICRQAGLPPGVLNIVHGRGPTAGETLVTHEEIKAVSFTGGTKTGAHIARLAAPAFKKLSLEMGGKNPNIIFADCHFEKALKTTVRSSFANQGQICLTGSRIYIQSEIYHDFRKGLVEKARQLVVGDPLKEGTDQGAVVSGEHYEKILSHLEIARREGGKILCGGEAVKVEGRCEGGWFIEPTVIEGLGPQARTNQEEIFGPVVTLTPFEREEEVLKMANGTSYGLAGTIWTENLSRAHRMAEKLESGVIWINCWLLRDLRTPFGGLKSSGVGREGGWYALEFFTEPKNVCVKLS